MSSSRRLKLRLAERHPKRPPIQLVFARSQYDCRSDLPRSLRYEKWKATIAERLKATLGPRFAA